MISIAMATYNGEAYLHEQINSILNQTYSNFELIICDDCSTDNTPQILNEYKNKDNRIKVFFNEKNLGFKKNFEKALSFCTGEYIAFCDQDDVWENFKLQESLENIKDKMLLCTDALLVDANLNSLGRTFKQNLGLHSVPVEQTFLLKSLIHHSFIQGTTIVCSSAFIKRHLPIPEDCMFHDLYFAVWAAIENSITYLDKPTVLYRQHEKNVIGNKKHSRLSFLKPVGYDKNKVLKKCREKICLINLELQNTTSKDMINYLQASKKYYEVLPEKKFYTLFYVNKYYKYFVWHYSALKKFLTLIKRFFGIVVFKLRADSF